MPIKKKEGNDRLSRRRVLEVAIKFADSKGLNKLNMRSLAKQLNSPVMNLYTYIQNKEELINGMVDYVASEITVPVQEKSWRKAITEIAVTAHETFYKHPWVIGLWSSTGGPAKMKHEESILRVLREAGFSVSLACRGYHSITMHIVGFTMQAVDFPRDAKAMRAAAANFLEHADTSEIPYFAEHVQHHYDYPESDGVFVFVLNMILDGLEKHLEES